MKKKGGRKPCTFLSLLFSTRKGNIGPKVVGLLALMIRLELFVTEQIVSSDLICDINLADIVPGYKTDHSMILLMVALHHNPRGRGFWMLNTSLLKDKEYLNLIKTTIYQTKSEYQSHSAVTPALLLDIIKMKVREKSISYATAKNHKSKSSARISFSKKYPIWKKYWMKTLA